jgi:hypothetical protein
MHSGKENLQSPVSSRVLRLFPRVPLRLVLRLLAIPLLFSPVPNLCGREKDAVDYGAGLIMTLQLPTSEVESVVAEVAQNGIIRGTKEYNKDEYITGAVAASSTRIFPPWTEEGKVFYKVRTQAIDPRNFKDAGDVGTLAVRYVVQNQPENSTLLRINALFVEDFRHTVHLSNGSVEASEFKDIREHLDSLELMKKEADEAERTNNNRRHLLNKAPTNVSGNSAEKMTGFLGRHSQATPVPERKPDQTLEDYVRVLRHETERLVKSPGAALKSAPFRSASTLKNLSASTEVLIVVSTAYWYGVETHDGQHGWLPREDLEELP